MRIILDNGGWKAVDKRGGCQGTYASLEEALSRCKQLWNSEFICKTFGPGLRVSWEYTRTSLRRFYYAQCQSCGKAKTSPTRRPLCASCSKTGDGTLVIGGKCPDFADTWGNLIELYGDHWHKGQDPNKRIRFFARLGYRCLVLWEHEVRQETTVAIGKVNKFLGKKGLV